MKKLLPVSLLLAGLLSSCATFATKPADGSSVTVEFQKPDDFRDVRDSLGGSTDQNALEALRMYLQENAPTRLQSGQQLRVTFTDIDLAGDFPGSSGGRYDRVRIIKSIY